MEIKVGELIQKAKVSRCGDGDYPVLSMTMHEGLMFQNDRFKKQIASVDQSNYQVVKRHQLVESFPIDEGVLAVQELTDEGIVSPAYKIWDVNKDKVIPLYLELALRSPRSIEYYKSKLRGTTARRRSITDAEFCAMQINCPDLREQEKIIELITRAKAIAAKRKQELDTLDELIKARFVELFGLPVTNTKGWKTLAMGDVAPAVNYNGSFDEDVWLLNLDMVEAQTGRILDYLYVSEDEVGNSTCTFDTSNVLYSKLRPYLNKVVIPDRCGYATSELVPLKPDPDVLNREYLAFMLRSDEFVNMINEKVAGAKMPRVSMGDFRKFEVPLPPIDLQSKFTVFVKQVDKSKFAA